MGPSDRHLEELISQKDEQIKCLDNRCSAYLAKISLLQTRLQRTFDTLDEVQNARAEETLSLNTTIAHLRERLRRCIIVAESAEMERDDMKDAVLRLVEKVETTNDYSHWPHSQIHLSILSDPLAHPIAPEPSSIRDQEDRMLSYATSIIEELRRERDAEKISHARTRAVAEAKIMDLEAKLSRREAELESYVGHVDREQDQDATFTPKASLRDASDEPITSQQVISMLDATVARNKILELEIKALLQQLDQARAGPSTSTTTANLRSKTLAPMRTQDSQSSSNDESYDQQVSGPSIQKNDRSILEDFEHQIHELAIKIDAFRDERRILLTKIPETGSKTPDENTPLHQLPKNDIPDRLMFLEREYERLRRTENDLRHEPNPTLAQSRPHEEEVEKSVHTIRADLHTAVITRPNEDQNPDGETGYVSDLLAEPSDGELSMELATPLLPISSISVHPSPGPAHQVLSSTSVDPGLDERRSPDVYQYQDPSSLPLPPSPESPLEDPSPWNPPPVDQPEALRDGLVHLENELVDTQRELEAGQAALEQLSELIDEL